MEMGLRSDNLHLINLMGMDMGIIFHIDLKLPRVCMGWRKLRLIT